MALIETGQPAPEFSFATYEGDRFTREDLMGRITVLVSHRFSTVTMTDLIMVLDGGRLVASGNHETLVAADGVYRS